MSVEAHALFCRLFLNERFFVIDTFFLFLLLLTLFAAKTATNAVVRPVDMKFVHVIYWCVL